LSLVQDLVSGVTALRASAERKRAEEALHQAREELAHVMRVTTLGEFAASIAHEINQPRWRPSVPTLTLACTGWLPTDQISTASGKRSPPS